MIVSIALLSLGFVGAPSTGAVSFAARPQVQVWTNRGDDAYAIGQPVQVSFQTQQDAYVTLFRVDTDGRVRVLYPREPWEDNFARGGRVYNVPSLRADGSFYVDDDPGVGYLFGVASIDPFAYDAIATAEHWDYRSIADDGRVRGDPYVALTDLAERLVPAGSTDWDYDVVPYYVQQHYQYPRFLCYDCHSYVSYSRWNPYDYSCIRFRIVVFDDPYYYPYRRYGGTRVVFARPYRPDPRFIFKDRVRGEAFVTRVRGRPENDDRRREVGVRGRDLGGSGTVPPPGADRRRRPDVRDRSADNARPERSARPDNTGRRVEPPRSDAPPRTESPRRAEPPRRGEPRREPERRAEPPSRAEPRREPERRAEPPSRAEPRREPERRAEPRTDSKRDGDSGKRGEPELRRRRS